MWLEQKFWVKTQYVFNQGFVAFDQIILFGGINPPKKKLFWHGYCFYYG